MTLAELASVLDVPCREGVAFTGISIDSRQIRPGNLFMAIKGERFNGHDFINDAVAAGAVGVITQQKQDSLSVPQLMVKDTLKALADLATHHRQKFTCAIIALTGSNGKTTVKEMIASILPKPSYATQGNFNNHIGVPLSVLNLNADHRFAVFELGANHHGEIAQTVKIVKPKVTLINNIAPAHIEGFGSIEGVAVAKGEIHEGLAKGGTAVINDDDHYAYFWDEILKDKNTVRFSMTEPKDVYARDIHIEESGHTQFILVTPKGEAAIKLRVPGRHNISNALAAAACSYALGVSLTDIANGLNQFNGVEGRMTYRQGKNNALIIDDTYNANVRSAHTALEVLANCKGRRILVMGDMGELGDLTQQYHEEIGQTARELGIDGLLTCGNHSAHTTRFFGENAIHYKNQEDLTKDLLRQLDEHTTVLVKGSRSAAMENIVKPLLD